MVIQQRRDQGFTPLMERAHVEVDNARMITPKTGAYPKLTRTIVAPCASIRGDNAPSWWLVHFYMSKVTDWSEALAKERL